MTILQSCCCCIPLRTGGIILGVLSLVGSLIAIIQCSAAISQLDDPSVQAKFKEDYRLKEQDFETSVSATKIWNGVNIGLAIITMVTSGMLIYGSVKKIRWLAIPYLVSETIRCVVYVLFFVSQIYAANSAISEDLKLDAILMAVGIFFAIVVQIYFMVCVYALFQWLREEKNRPQYAYNHASRI